MILYNTPKKELKILLKVVFPLFDTKTCELAKVSVKLTTTPNFEML